MEVESDKAFEAFTVYRDMGPGRSLAKTAAQIGKDPTLMERWSSKHHWIVRAAAFDVHRDDIHLKAQEKERVQMAERHAKMAMLMQQKLVERLRGIDPDELSHGELARWAETAVKIERLSRGEPNEMLQMKMAERPDLSLLEDEDLQGLIHTLERISGNGASTDA